MRRLGRIAAFALLIAVLGAFALHYAVSRPYAGFEPPEVFVTLERGMPTTRIAALLAENGVVESRWHFLAVRLLRPSAPLQAGEYRFHRPASAWEIYDRLSRGDIYFIRLLIPEGYSVFDVAQAVEDAGLASREEFLEAARDPSPIRDLAPQATSLEGYLFPDTYNLPRRTSSEAVCRLMTARFRKAWEQVGGQGDPHRTVTLASLVEKETGVGSERHLVASVFVNRLRLNMPLQCDPTVIYAALLEDRYRGTIYQSDLANPHPYNTYRNPGLPPGPIASPGLEALEATLRPADSSYLYFVARADGSGAHVFSETLEQHEQAVRAYRRALQRKAKETPAS